MDDERQPKPPEVDENALNSEETPAPAALPGEESRQPSRVGRFWFAALLLVVFGVPALATWPITKYVPISWLLMIIILLGLTWVFALVLFGEYMSRGESAPLSTEILIGAAAFFLLLAVLGFGMSGFVLMRKVGYLWVAGFIITAGAVIRLYREPTNPRHPLELFASLALMLVAWLLIYLTRFDYIFGISLVIILAVYWLFMAPPRESGRSSRRRPSI